MYDKCQGGDTRNNHGVCVSTGVIDCVTTGMRRSPSVKLTSVFSSDRSFS